MNRKERRAILDECGAKRKARRLHIRASLLVNGYTETRLAAENGISQQCMNKVVHAAEKGVYPQKAVPDRPT